MSSRGFRRRKRLRASYEDAPEGAEDASENTYTYKAFISYSHAVDGQFAPALQRALHQFAKPWYMRRAVRVFRDESSLSASPELWPSIERVLVGSEYFLLLASPKAATSPWVAKEVEYWCEHKSRSNFLIALTDGSIVWDNDKNDFDWQETNALSASLSGTFQEEPRYIDFTWAREHEHLTLSHARFKECVADIAAPLHGRDKDDLIGEDVRQHRHTRRLAGTAIMSLIVLTLATTVAAFLAVGQRNAARAQARVATSRGLSATAINMIDTNYQLALMLAAQARHVANTPESRSGLLSTLASNPHHLAFLRHEGDLVTVVAWSPDGNSVVSGTLAGEIRLWDVEQRSSRVVADRGRSRLTALEFSPDGELVAAGSDDGSLALWGVGAEEQEEQVVSSGDGEPVMSLRFSPGGDLLAWGAMDNIGLWDVTDARAIAEAEAQYGPGPEVFFSPDGAMVVSLEYFGDVTFLDARTGERVGSADGVGPPGMPIELVYSSTGDLRASANSTWYVAVTDPATGEWIGEGFQGPSNIDAMAFSPDGELLAVAGASEVQVWDTFSQSLQTVLSGYPDRILSLAFSSDGLTLAASSGQTVVVSDLQKPLRLGRVLSEPTEVPTVVDNVASVSFSSDGLAVTWADTSGGAGGIEWVQSDVATGTEIVRRPAMEGDFEFSSEELPSATTQATTRDGTLVAFGVSDGSIVVRDGQTDGDIVTLPPPAWAADSAASAIEALDFSTDGRLLAAAAGGGITLWDVRAARVLVNLPGGYGARVALSPDGSTLATMTSDGVITLFDTASRQRLGALSQGIAQPAGVDIAFSPDGRTLASTVSGGGLMLWDMSPSSWSAQACLLADRELTEEELDQFVGQSFREASCSGPPASSTTSTTSATTTAPRSPTTVGLRYGRTCARGSHRDCIDPGGDGRYTYLKGGGDCMATFRDTAGLCSDLDEDGEVGYPASG